MKVAGVVMVVSVAEPFEPALCGDVSTGSQKKHKAKGSRCQSLKARPRCPDMVPPERM